MAQDYDTLRTEIDRVLLLPGTAQLDYQTVDRLCLSLLFHVSLWSLRYGVQMEEVLRTLGAHYTDIHQCGYADTSNFIRVFKKYYGISPVEYRAAQGGAE